MTVKELIEQLQYCDQYSIVKLKTSPDTITAAVDEVFNDKDVVYLIANSY